MEGQKIIFWNTPTLLYFYSLLMGAEMGMVERNILCLLLVCFLFFVFSIECGGPVFVPRKEGVTPWRWPPLPFFPGAPILYSVILRGPRVQHYNNILTPPCPIIYHLSFIKSYFTPESMIIAFSIISIIKFPRFNLAAVPVGKKKENKRLKVFGRQTETVRFRRIQQTKLSKQFHRHFHSDFQSFRLPSISLGVIA